MGHTGVVQQFFTPIQVLCDKTLMALHVTGLQKQKTATYNGCKFVNI